VPRGTGPAEGACAKLCKTVTPERSAITAHERLIDLAIASIILDWLTLEEHGSRYSKVGDKSSTIKMRAQAPLTSPDFFHAETESAYRQSSPL
jgi:hypothetical protein